MVCVRIYTGDNQKGNIRNRDKIKKPQNMVQNQRRSFFIYLYTDVYLRLTKKNIAICYPDEHKIFANNIFEKILSHL